MIAEGRAELLAPAGDFDTALSAFDAGADAVYCGLSDYSARAFAQNFSPDDLRRLMRLAKAKGKKVYVTFNTVLDEDQLEGAVETLAMLSEIGPDAVIVQDLGVARICRRHFPELTLHASTQMVAHNLEGVLQLGELGFRRVVLARELSLEEVSSIARRCGDIELECFIHGALCYSISGLCLFGAMEKGRSGNRGKCPYCCRVAYDDGNGGKTLAFSMKDLRLGEDVRKLSAAGVASLKIEGRMKSPLYVASVTSYYRRILDGGGKPVTRSDLETVFSRRTTELYLNGSGGESPIDPTALGHLGTPIGSVKRVTKDRDGFRWLRFHTSRALEKHDGLQFANPEGGKPFGFGIGEMRQAISRTPVFEVAAGSDVEILLPELPEGDDWTRNLKTGETVFCSMSNAVKRAFPVPSYRDSDYPGTEALTVEVSIRQDRITARSNGQEVAIEGTFDGAKNPDKTFGAVEKAFSKLGGSDYRLDVLKLDDAERRFAPASVLNDLRRDLVCALDDARAKTRRERIAAALDDGFPEGVGHGSDAVLRTVKVCVGQKIPAVSFDETVVAINAETQPEDLAGLSSAASLRLALPVYTPEPGFNRLRIAVKRLFRAGYAKWEASDLAALRMLKQIGVSDITADWTLYAFNSQALAQLTELGVKRFVASPENGADNIRFLAESGYPVEFLTQQSTPLFISLTKPMTQNELVVFERDGVYVTTRRVPRTFTAPSDVATRVDLSWDSL